MPTKNKARIEELRAELETLEAEEAEAVEEVAEEAAEDASKEVEASQEGLQEGGATAVEAEREAQEAVTESVEEAAGKHEHDFPPEVVDMIAERTAEKLRESGYAISRHETEVEAGAEPEPVRQEAEAVAEPVEHGAETVEAAPEPEPEPQRQSVHSDRDSIRPKEEHGWYRPRKLGRFSI